MKTIASLLFAVSSFAAIAQADEQDVKQVITTSYIRGIHNGGPIEDIRKGFHTSFNMLQLIDNEVKPLPIKEWITNIEANRTKNSNAVNPKVEGKFITVSVAGSSASVALELYREGKKIFTDHLLLYKFNEGWRIVSKTFYRQP
ncbi:MAG: nuclear transport factor 2 family protein [Bacteroidetes bacterium]|nr:nuclear transport factor 2 family protein [Bacteroidota bacterium]MBI3482176.1 nuclear transport factor 2 family protein [Bacteroidota bacterium]